MLEKVKNFIKDNRKAIAAVLVAVSVSFPLGLIVCSQFAEKEKAIETIEKHIVVKGDAETVTKTQIAYVPKETVIREYIDSTTGKTIKEETVEDTDLDATIGKTEFDVKLNGKDITFKKDDNERFVFDKNKVLLEQTSTVTFNATVSPYVIDKTKRWSIGIGKSEHSGTAYMIDFPIGKSNIFAGWIYKDDDNNTIGIKYRF